MYFDIEDIPKRRKKGMIAGKFKHHLKHV